MIKEPAQYSFPELTELEFNVLLSILQQVNLNMTKRNQGYTMHSTCNFIFDIESGLFEAFHKLSYKFKETEIQRLITQKQEKEGN